MPAPRSYQGITKAEYSANNSNWTEITNLTIDSAVRFLEQGDEAKQNFYGGRYPGPEKREYEIQFLNRTIYDTLEGNWRALTANYFRFTLDNDELHVTTIAVLPSQMRPLDLSGRMEGRGDVFMLMIEILDEQVTETTA